MAQKTIYLPEELAERLAKYPELPVSKICQLAIHRAIRRAIEKASQ